MPDSRVSKRPNHPTRRRPKFRLDVFAKIESSHSVPDFDSTVKGIAMASTTPRRTAFLVGLALVCWCAGLAGCSKSGAASAAFNAGLKQFNAGNNEKAIESFSEAIRLKPDDDVAYYN